MVTNANLKYANTSNYYVIMMLQNLKKIPTIDNFQFFRISEARSAELKQTTNREALVVCARHVVERPSKLSAPVLNIISGK